MDSTESKNSDNEYETANNINERKDKFLNIDNNTNWEKLLPKHDPDLVDKLLIFSRLTQKPPLTASDDILQTYLDWVDLFFKTKGFQHLIQIFENCENCANENLPLLTILLPLINLFFIDAISCESSMNDTINKIFNLYPNYDVFLKEFNETVTKQSGIKQPFKVETKNEQKNEDEFFFDMDLQLQDDEKTQLNTTFADLNQKIKQKYAGSVIHSVDFSKLLIKSLKVFKAASTKLIIMYSTKLWISLVLYKPALFPDLFEFIQNDASFILNTIQANDFGVRFEFLTSIFRLCAVLQLRMQQKLPADKVIGFLLKDVLIKDLPKCNVENNQHLQTYLEALVFLLHQYTGCKYNHNVTEFPQLFEYVIQELKSYKSRESFHSTSDGVMCGLMTILSLLLCQHKPYRQQCIKSGFMQELWHNFIFANGQTQNDKASNLPKCKQNESKSLAFRLIIQCISELPEMQSNIIKKIQQFQNEFISAKQIYSWEYAPAKSMRSDTGYVGLKNHGSTDYMNCMLQQFYMMPTLRNNLISAGMDIAPKLTGEQCIESVLYQIMRMFCFLSLSTRQAYDTLSFCRSWKDDEGLPIDVRIQRDVHEFFNRFTERVRIGLQNTEFTDLLTDNFGVEICTQMICQGGCGNVRERKQECMEISMSIKHQRNLEQALKSYVATEQLEGVQCDKCNAKCDTLKREVIGKLQKKILFQLKRFELNFQTFQSEKVYDRFEFPLEIDLKQFTKAGILESKSESKENIEDECCIYELSGIIIHSGNEENGHYFSYIRDRYNGAWLEFNDCLVKPFDINNLDDATFGGVNSVNNEDKLACAYGLIYERKQSVEEKTDIEELIANKVPNLANEILENNSMLMRDIQLYNIPYFEFLYNLTCIAPKYQQQDDEKDDGLDVTKMTTLVCLKYVTRTAEKNELLKKFMHYLKFLYEDNTYICSWFLQYLSKKESSVEQYILTTRDVLVRTCVSDLIIHSLRQFKENTINKSVSAFMNRMVELIDIAPKHWFRFTEYFRIFYEFSLMGYAQRNCLIEKELIMILGDFYLGGKRSPYATPTKQYHIMGSRMYPPKFDILVQTLSVLLCACHTPQTALCLKIYESKKDEMDESQKKQFLGLSPLSLSYKNAINNRNCLHELSTEDEKLPHSRFFYSKLIEQAHHNNDILNALNNIIVHWSFQDKKYSQEVCRIIAEGVDKSGADQVKTFLAIMHQFIMIEDVHQQYRFKVIHKPNEVNEPDKGIFHYILCYRIQHQPFTWECMKGITDMMTHYKPYLIYMISHRDDWFWWDKWLQQFTQNEVQVNSVFSGYLNYDSEPKPSAKLKEKRIDWYKEEYIYFLQKHSECLVYGFIKELVQQIDFQQTIPLDIMPEFVKFFW